MTTDVCSILGWKVDARKTSLFGVCRRRSELKRDRRLLVALMLFLAALIASLIQAWIVNLYIVAAVMGGGYWDHFIELFGLDPIVGPNQFCFDYCAPTLPFLAGWIGIIAFLSGCLTVAHPTGNRSSNGDTFSMAAIGSLADWPFSDQEVRMPPARF